MRGDEIWLQPAGLDAAEPQGSTARRLVPSGGSGVARQTLSNARKSTSATLTLSPMRASAQALVRTCPLDLSSSGLFPSRYHSFISSVTSRMPFLVRQTGTHPVIDLRGP